MKCYMLKRATPSSPMSIPGQLVLISITICSSNQACEELGSVYLHRLATPRILLLSDLHYNTKEAARNA